MLISRDNWEFYLGGFTYDELRDHVESLFGSVIENLTLHWMKFFVFVFTIS